MEKVKLFESRVEQRWSDA